ncbi:MAG TPA: DPP IV N-terminal domain-containing protein [Streptosporangiaceae bacterium]|nr:DPP IV N-terminal domain-containing protein [Streptosporangiaceae bacterium]
MTQHSHAGRKVFPAREGKIVFVNAPAASGVLAPGRFAIQVIRPDGIGRTTIFSQHREIDSPPRWSPNGKQIVFSMNSARSTSSSLYIINANRTGLRKVSTGRRDNESPAWSPDGTKIAFSSHLASSPDQHIFVKDLKTGTVSRVTGGTAGDTGPAWSPDGTKIAFDRCGVRRGGTCHLWVKDLATGQLRQVTSGPSSDQDPAWSPDGRRIAFASSRTGRWNIFTMRAAGGGLVQVTNTKRGGLSLAPSWSPDGKWIAFEAERNGPFNIFAARAIRDGRVRRLTDVKPPRNAQYPDWRR